MDDGDLRSCDGCGEVEDAGTPARLRAMGEVVLRVVR